MIEQDWISQILSNLDSAENSSKELIADRDTNQIREESSLDDPDSAPRFSPEDTIVGSENPIIVFPIEEFISLQACSKCKSISFFEWDNGEVYNACFQTCHTNRYNTIPGSINPVNELDDIDIDKIGYSNDHIRIVVNERILTDDILHK